jgi:excisionase family DNA binding protein
MEDRFTIAEASELTGLSKRALARRIERGQLSATKEGRLRYVTRRDLAAAGLVNPATGAPPVWARQRVDASVVAKEIVQTLVQQSVELHEVRSQLRELIQESRNDDRELREEIERARDERRQLRKLLEDARNEIAGMQHAPS